MDLEDSLKTLRKTHGGDEAGKVYEAFLSHAAVARKNRLLLTLLDEIRKANAEASEVPGLGVFAQRVSYRTALRWIRLTSIYFFVLFCGM